MTIKKYTNAAKVRIMDETKAEGKTVREVARANKIHHSLIVRWLQNENEIRANPRKQTLHKGPKVQGVDIEAQIIEMIEHADFRGDVINHSILSRYVVRNFPTHLLKEGDFKESFGITEENGLGITELDLFV